MSTSAHGEPPAAGSARSRRTVVQRILEVVISLVFLALALNGISWAELAAALKQANYLWLLPAVLITIALLFLKAWRWQLMFRPEHDLPFRSVFTALCAGYLGSNVLPARAGELVRLVLLVSEQPVSAARTLSTIVVERILDLLSVLLVMVVLLPVMAARLPAVSLPEWMLRSAQGLGLAALAASIAIVVLSFWKYRLLAWAHRILGHIRFLDRPGVYASLGHVIDGFATLRGRTGPALILTSVLGWVGVIGMAWSAAFAFRLGPDRLPFEAVVLAVVVTTISMVVPSSPGYIGVFHYMVTLALAPFAVAPFFVTKDEALGFALLWHATNYLTLSLSGVVALWVHGTSLGKIMARLRRRDPVAEQA